ncbi:hypothetical protein [Pseudidiomarina salilacus]|uniref:hypothetical protein n=1 Tax=Pseudidiomarina salilacus TaxID=3384452 RepID=UPI00398549C3
MKFMQTLMSASLLALLVGCSAAAEGIGNVTAEFDGTRYSGITLGDTSEHQASATLRNFGSMTMLNLQAHDTSADSMMKNVFNIEIGLSSSGSSPQVMSAQFSYWPNGMGEKFYSSEETAVKVTFEQFSAGEDAKAVGTFSGRMCAKADFYSAADTSDCKEVTGTFDTQLVNES